MCQTVVEKRQTMDLQQSLINIGLSENAARLYLRLLEIKKASARQLAEYLDISRPSVYDHLKLLINHGLVTEMGEDNKKMFHVEDPAQLMGYIQGNIESFTKESETIAKLLPKYASEDEVSVPRIKSYSGADNIKKILNEMLWHDDIETYTMWPTHDMVEILGAEFLEEFNRKRIRRNISVKSIWPRGESADQKKYPFIGVGKKHLRERRIAPRGIKWQMSYWLYLDKVIFVSSKKEGFGFVVQSSNFASLIKANFDIVWSVSEPVPPEAADTNAFLKTI